jgi:APA family basic amino acid/polyamine antiporter
LIALALLSSLSAFIIIGPRIYFAMARDRLFLQSAAKVHPRFKVPERSIVIQGIIASVVVIAGSFKQVLVYLGFALGIFPLLVVAALFITRSRNISEKTVVKTPGYPFTPIFFMTVTFILMVIAYINRPLESSTAVLTVLAGIPCYYIWIRSMRDAGAPGGMRGHQLAIPHDFKSCPSLFAALS